MSGSRARDYDDDEWMEKPKAKVARKKGTLKSKCPRTFDRVDAQKGSLFLSRTATTFRIAMLTQHLGFRDCLAFARSCKLTYLDMVSNPLFLRYYVRSLLRRHQIVPYRNEYEQLRRLAPFAGVSDVSFVNTQPHKAHSPHVFLFAHSEDEASWRLASCVTHMDDAKRALATHGFQLDNVIHSDSVSHCHPETTMEMQTTPHWSSRLSSILLSWERGTGGCLSEWTHEAWQKTVLFTLLHTFDLEGSVFSAYFTNPLYQCHYRNNVFGTCVLDVWRVLDRLMDNPPHPPMAAKRSQLAPRLLLSDSLHTYAALCLSSYAKSWWKYVPSWEYLRSNYYVHVHLARELLHDAMEPVKMSGKIWESRSGAYVTHGDRVASVEVLFRMSRFKSVNLHVGALAAPELLGVQAGDWFYPRKTLWLQWRDVLLAQ